MTNYRIKLENGRVLGPFSLQELEELSEKGHINGNELVQVFPTGNWIALKSYKELSYILKKIDLKNEDKGDATFIKKLNLSNLQSNDQEDQNTNNDFIDEQQKSISKSDGVFPQVFEFKKENEEDEVVDEVDDDIEEEVLTETYINDPKESKFDKTEINPDTLKYLGEMKKKAQKEREKAKKLEAIEKAKEPEFDLDNDATQLIDTRSLKSKLREEIQETENKIYDEDLKKKEAEKRKLENIKKKKQKEENEDKLEEVEEAKAKKKKKILLIAGTLFLLVLLFPDNPDKKVKKIEPIQPYISFPQRFDVPDEKKASDFYKKGLEEYNKHTYVGYLNAVEYFKASVENQFSDNPATYKLIYLYSEMLDDVTDNLIRTDNANTTFKLLQIFMTKVYSEPSMATAAANFYYSINKYAAAVKVIEKFMTIKTNKPSMELFGVYLKSLLKTGDLEKAKKVYEKLKAVENRSYVVDIRIMEFLNEIEQKDEAIAILNQLQKRFNNNVYLLLTQAKMYLYADDYPSLKVILDKIKDLEAEKSPSYFAKYLEYRGMLAVKDKDVKKAVKLFKRSLSINENLELRSRLANLDETQDQQANALIIESKAIKFIGVARNHLKNKNEKLAFKAALDAVSIAPNYIPAKLFLSKLQITKSFFNEAIKSLEALYEKNINNYDVVYALMNAYVEAYKFKELDRIIRDIAQTDFRVDPRFLKIQAVKYLKKDNFSFAIQWLQQAINRNPLDDELIFQMADLYIKYKKFSQGKVLLKKAMELDPSKVEYEIKYAEIIYEIDGPEAAIGYLYNILQEFPDNVKALSQVGIYYYNTGQMKFFEETKKKIEKVANKDKSLYKFLILAAKRDEKPEKVIEYSKELLIIDPGDLEARMFLGKVYVEQEMYKEALNEFRAIEEKLNTYPQLKFNLSKLYLLADNIDKAIEYAEEEISANPTSVNGYVLLGDIHKKKKEYAMSEKYYKSAQKINSSNVDALIGLATLNFMKSQFAISLDLFIKAKKIEPERAETYKLLGDVYRKIGQSTLAVEQYKTFLELSPSTMYRENLTNYIKMME